MLYSKFSSKSFILLARILAQDVLPTPLGPQNKDTKKYEETNSKNRKRQIRS